MFSVNISAILDSLDTVAKETLEEPKESATRIRSKRKQAASTSRGVTSDDLATTDGIIKEDDENDEVSSFIVTRSE